MERRRFLQLLGLGVGGVAIEQAIPLGRVWSFPKEIVTQRCFIGTDLGVRIPQRWILKDGLTWQLDDQAIRWYTRFDIDELRQRVFVPITSELVTPADPSGS